MLTTQRLHAGAIRLWPLGTQWFESIWPLVRTASSDQQIHIQRDSSGRTGELGPFRSSPSAPVVTILLLLCSKLYPRLISLLLYFAPVAEPPGLCCSATTDLRFPQWSLEGNKTLPQDKQQWEPEGPGGGWEEDKEAGGRWKARKPSCSYRRLNHKKSVINSGVANPDSV